MMKRKMMKGERVDLGNTISAEFDGKGIHLSSVGGDDYHVVYLNLETLKNFLKYIKTLKDFDLNTFDKGDHIHIGTVFPFFGELFAHLKERCLPCDGREINLDDYPELAALDVTAVGFSSMHEYLCIFGNDGKPHLPLLEDDFYMKVRA